MWRDLTADPGGSLGPAFESVLAQIHGPGAAWVLATGALVGALLIYFLWLQRGSSGVAPMTVQSLVAALRSHAALSPVSPVQDRPSLDITRAEGASTDRSEVAIVRATAKQWSQCWNVAWGEVEAIASVARSLGYVVRIHPG